MNRFLVGFCLGIMLSACEVGITNSPEKIQDDTSETEDEATPEAEEEPAEDETGIEDISEDDAEEPLVDFSQSGPFSVTVDSRTASVTDCSSMSYRIYTPSVGDPPVVVLGHGFARGSDVMVGWAEHLASWGAEVLLPTLCHYNVFFGVDHEMNGQNMVDLGLIHGGENIVYAGHSAGGLAAIIAASLDNNSGGVLGLDVTDTEGVPGVDDFIGRDYASDVATLAFSLSGESSSCNSSNNGVYLFRMMTDYNAIKINNSDHCDFENPTDELCQISCENTTDLFEDEDIRTLIKLLGTSSIMILTDLYTIETTPWSESNIESMILSGVIEKIE